MHVPLPRRRGQHDRPRHERPAALERRAQRTQLLVLQAELDLDVVGDRRPGVGEVCQQPGPARVFARHPCQLGAADRINEDQQLVAQQDRLAAVNVQRVHVRQLGQLVCPRPLGRWPAREPATACLIRLLMTGLKQARQCGVGGTRKQTPFPYEAMRLCQRRQRTVGREPALVVASRAQRRQGVGHAGLRLRC